MNWSPSIYQVENCCSIQVVNGLPEDGLFKNTYWVQGTPVEYAKAIVKGVKEDRAEDKEDGEDLVKEYIVLVSKRTQSKMYDVFKSNPKVFEYHRRYKSRHGNYFIYQFGVKYASRQEIK